MTFDKGLKVKGLFSVWRSAFKITQQKQNVILSLFHVTPHTLPNGMYLFGFQLWIPVWQKVLFSSAVAQSLCSLLPSHLSPPPLSCQEDNKSFEDLNWNKIVLNKLPVNVVQSHVCRLHRTACAPQTSELLWGWRCWDMKRTKPSEVLDKYEIDKY